ncbi:MAG: aminopeptidase P family protein [Candidatus Kapaibacterium sp.]|nr:aminopeptidase P family protein [Bacteroidota bacterium]
MKTTILIFLLFTLNVFSQAPGVSFPFEQFENDGIPVSVLKNRRERIINNHSSKSLILSLSADIRNRQNDVDYEYRQNSNFLYLTGCTQNKTALILIPGTATLNNTTLNEIFFVNKRDVSSEVWNGVRMGAEEAKQYLGFANTMDYTSLLSTLDTLLYNRDTLFITGLPTTSVKNPITGKSTFIDQQIKDYLHDKYPTLFIRTSLPDVAEMRELKDADEIRLLQKAIDISVQAHMATMRAAKPNMNEYELEAEMEYVFHKLGAEDVGYPSIVGSGYNSCMLHYESNRRVAKEGEMILADCGAEYHGYTADITRTFPITGKYNEEQTIIYNIVLEAQDSGIAACRAGKPFKAAHEAARSVITKNLLNLGIIKEPAETKYYFMHGTSHYLGLDVHDVGTNKPLRPGVVMTVEPGIYIPSGSPCDKRWWNIGVRIEDDILVTDGEPVNMSGKLPRTIPDIEKLMKQGQ